MIAPDSIAAIRAVHDAATNLTLACTEIVGTVPMEISMPTVGVLGEPVPPELRRQVRALGVAKKGRKAR